MTPGAAILLAAASVLAGVAAPGQARGGETLIRNPSFEQDGTAIKGVGYVAQGNPIAGWTVSRIRYRLPGVRCRW